MLYAAMTFWLLVIVFSACGVHALWSRLIQPRVVNALLLPGTLVAQLGHVLGLLVTGNSVQNTALMTDDEQGQPQSQTPETPRLPIIGPILIGLLPLVACSACLYAAARLWGTPVVGGLDGRTPLDVPRCLPTTLSAVWELLRGSVTLMESLLNAIRRSDLSQWRTLLFLYLAVCLTVRMTPFQGNRRGAIAAILLAGLTIGVLGTAISPFEGLIEQSWPVLSFAVGMLLFLLTVSLLVTGLVELVKIMVKNQ